MQQDQCASPQCIISVANSVAGAVRQLLHSVSLDVSLCYAAELAFGCVVNFAHVPCLQVFCPMLQLLISCCLESSAGLEDDDDSASFISRVPHACAAQLGFKSGLLTGRG
jgi:hypothetical protein